MYDMSCEMPVALAPEHRPWPILFISKDVSTMSLVIVFFASLHLSQFHPKFLIHTVSQLSATPYSEISDT